MSHECIDVPNCLLPKKEGLLVYQIIPGESIPHLSPEPVRNNIWATIHRKMTDLKDTQHFNRGLQRFISSQSRIPGKNRRVVQENEFRLVRREVVPHVFKGLFLLHVIIDIIRGIRVVIRRFQVLPSQIPGLQILCDLKIRRGVTTEVAQTRVPLLIRPVIDDVIGVIPHIVIFVGIGTRTGLAPRLILENNENQETTSPKLSNLTTAQSPMLVPAATTLKLGAESPPVSEDVAGLVPPILGEKREIRVRDGVDAMIVPRTEIRFVIAVILQVVDGATT